VYYKLESDTGGEPNVYLEPLNNEFASTHEGTKITNLEDEYIELPFRFNMKIRKNDDGSYQEPRMRAYNPSDELMRIDLIKTLQDVGVDNIQCFPAILTHEGEEMYPAEYMVINLIGLIACASMDNSESIPFADGYFFNNLIIDPNKTYGLLMFRLAESKMDVLVHERVANELIKHNFPFLVLTPLEQVKNIN
jgi:hypothetical protein